MAVQHLQLASDPTGVPEVRLDLELLLNRCGHDTDLALEILETFRRVADAAFGDLAAAALTGRFDDAVETARVLEGMLVNIGAPMASAAMRELRSDLIAGRHDRAGALIGEIEVRLDTLAAEVTRVCFSLGARAS